MTFRYGVYGLSIEADAPIDGAPAADFTHPDIQLRMQAMPPFTAGDPLFDDENVTIFRHGERYLFQYRDVIPRQDHEVSGFRVNAIRLRNNRNKPCR